MELIFLPAKNNTKLLDYYSRALTEATELYILSAYLTNWAVTEPLNPECKFFRIIVGKDFGITRKQACQDVMTWLDNARQGQFLVAEDIDGFHPKAMFWRNKRGSCFAVIGSSNLSQAAFSENHEVNIYSQIDETEFLAAKKWVREIEKNSVIVSEAWLEQYTEAIQTKRKPKTPTGEKDTLVFELALPWPKDKKKLNQILADRRDKIAVFAEKRNNIEQLFRRASKANQNWPESKRIDFYNDLNSLWNDGEDGCRFQGLGWERRGKSSDFGELARSLIRVLDATDFERDDILSEEIDRMQQRRVPTRKALFSEMLCHFFPTEYPVLNGPVRKWRASTKFKAPKKATEGVEYIDLARKLRTALKRSPNHPAKSLAELDAVIWFSTQ